MFKKIKAGEYSIPPHVSPGARDIIHRMLQVNPLARMTVAQCMAHPWYRTQLPAYLALSAEQQIERTQAIDEQVLQTVVHMGASRERVLRAVSMGYELLTSRKMAGHTELRKVAVIYYLLRDAKRKREQQREEVIKDLQQSFTKPANSQNQLPSSMDSMEEPSIDYSKMSLPAARTLYALKEQSNLRNNGMNFLKKNLIHTGNRWQLGERSHEDPQRIMQAIYILLKKFNFEWKVLSLYKVKARYPAGLTSTQNGLMNIHGNPMAPSEVCKIGITLYKGNGTSNGGHRSSPPPQQPSNTTTAPMSVGYGESSSPPHHIIDIQKLYGEMFLFLQLVSNMMAELHATQLS